MRAWKRLYAEGVRCAVIARAYDTTMQAVWQLVTGKRRGHVNVPKPRPAVAGPVYRGAAWAKSRFYVRPVGAPRLRRAQHPLLHRGRHAAASSARFQPQALPACPSAVPAPPLAPLPLLARRRAGPASGTASVAGPGVPCAPGAKPYRPASDCRALVRPCGRGGGQLPVFLPVPRALQSALLRCSRPRPVACCSGSAGCCSANALARSGERLLRRTPAAAPASGSACAVAAVPVRPGRSAGRPGDRYCLPGVSWNFCDQACWAFSMRQLLVAVRMSHNW